MSATTNASSEVPSASAVWLKRLLGCGIGAVLIVLLFAALDWTGTDYAYLAAYTVVQFILLATAWNILGGYAGYVNFGTAAFFAIGCYTTVFCYKAFQLPLLATLPISAVLAGLVGLGTGYLTLRLRGVFFSICTLAMAVVLQTLVTNWNYVGGSRGAYILRPESVPLFGSYSRFLFAIMLAMAIGSVLLARHIERTWLGRGLAAIRDEELAAESSGVPALRLKLIATSLSGALMGLAGTPFPYFITYVDPTTAFSLNIAVNTIAMPLIGGTATWLGPVVGALLLGIIQQWVTVTISSSLNLMIVGVLLVLFVAVAPNGMVGFVQGLRRRKA